MDEGSTDKEQENNRYMNPKYPDWKPGRGLNGEWIRPEWRNCGPEELETAIINEIQRLSDKTTTFDMR